MRYSFNLTDPSISGTIAFAQRYDLNASYKDLGAVCDAVRYMRADKALELIDKIAKMEMPIIFRRHNKHMGARHETGGKKGAYPVKAAKEMRIAILNAIANAGNKSLGSESDLIIIHATANKTQIMRRYPSKGSISWGRGMYGRSATNHSDIEYARIELAVAAKDQKWFTQSMKYFIRLKNRNIKETVVKPAKQGPAKKSPEKAPAPAKKEVKKEAVVENKSD